MKRRLLFAATVVAAVVLATPGNAAAYSQTYCGVLLQPGHGCASNGLHSWRFNRANYPGPWQHQVYVCEWMYNASTNRVRGNGPYCAYNNIETDYGPTSLPNYNAKVALSNINCCAHTVVGYARTG